MTNSTLINTFLNDIGWDSMLNDLVQRKFKLPPYNIIEAENGISEIQLALAGYSKDEISVTFQDRVLTISSSGVDKQDDVKYNYRGVAKRAFTTKFSLGQHFEVQDVTMNNGMLHVLVKRFYQKRSS